MSDRNRHWKTVEIEAACHLYTIWINNNGLEMPQTLMILYFLGADCESTIFGTQYRIEFSCTLQRASNHRRDWDQEYFGLDYPGFQNHIDRSNKSYRSSPAYTKKVLVYLQKLSWAPRGFAAPLAVFTLSNEAFDPLVFWGPSQLTSHWSILCLLKYTICGA